MKREIELNIHVIIETERAIMIKDLNDKDCWIPKSQIDLHEDKESMIIPEWLAIDKELV